MLVSSEPAANSRLATSPPQLRLVYSEPVEGKLARVTIVPSSGAPLVLKPTGDPRDVHAVIAPMAPLAPGNYRVEWRVVSADGHPVDGKFVFAIADTTLGAQPALPPTPEPENEPEPEADVWGPALFGAPVVAAVLRGAALGSLIALAGLLLYHARSQPNAAQRSDARLRSLTTTFAIAAPLLLAAHLIVWLIGTSPDRTFDAEWVTATLAASVGQVEIWRTGLALLALWAWALARRPGLALLLAAAALVASGAVGHSAAIQPVWGIPSKAIHLLASAAWLGGLLWLVVRPAADDVNLFAADAERVSSNALAAVIAVAFTGVVQTRLFLPSWSALTSSPYGWLALAKTAGLLVLVGFGAHHRQRLMPRIAAAARAATDVATLRSSVAREIAVMVVVILLGGLLAYVPPPAEGHASTSSQQSRS
jgi:copper transport protein